MNSTHGGSAASGGISLGLFPALAARINWLESIKVTLQEKEAKREVIEVGRRMANAHARVAELYESLVKVEQQGTSTPWLRLLNKLRGIQAKEAVREAPKPPGWAQELYQQACEEARLAEASLRRVTSHYDAMREQVDELKSAWAEEDRIHAAVFNWAPHITGTTVTAPTLNTATIPGPHISKVVIRQHNVDASCEGNLRCLQLDRQGLALAAALSAETARRDRLQTESDRMHIALDLLRKSNAKANWTKLKLKEAVAMCLPQNILDNWLSVLESSPERAHTDYARGSTNSCSIGEGLMSSKCSDTFLMAGFDEQVPAQEYQVHHKSRCSLSKRDSFEKISWSISSISEAGEAEPDRGSWVTYQCGGEPAAAHASLPNFVGDQICNLDVAMQQSPFDNRFTTLLLPSIRREGLQRIVPSQCPRLPLHLPLVSSESIQRCTNMPLHSDSRACFVLTGPGSDSVDHAAKTASFCDSHSPGYSMLGWPAVSEQVPSTPNLSSDALDLVRIARKSFRAAYRDRMAGEELALKGSDSDEAISSGGPEVTARMLIQMCAATKLTEPDFKLLHDTPLIPMTVAEQKCRCWPNAIAPSSKEASSCLPRRPAMNIEPPILWT